MDVKQAIRLNYQYLDLTGTAIPLDEGDVLLATVVGLESDFGANNKPRYEKSYLPGGLNYRKSLLVRKLYTLHGRNACASWGPFQIMYPTAWRQGYRGIPVALADAAVSIAYVIKYLNNACLCWEGATLEDVADGYNSGYPFDQVVPQDYINKFIKYFNGPARVWMRGK